MEKSSHVRFLIQILRLETENGIIYQQNQSVYQVIQKISDQCRYSQRPKPIITLLAFADTVLCDAVCYYPPYLTPLLKLIHKIS